MCHMYRPFGVGYSELSRKMVTPYPFSSVQTASPIVSSSFSNYGGVPVKAEYCHEAVSCKLVIYDIL